MKEENREKKKLTDKYRHEDRVNADAYGDNNRRMITAISSERAPSQIRKDGKDRKSVV